MDGSISRPEMMAGASNDGFLVGYDYSAFKSQGSALPVYWDPYRLTNCHVGVVGMSGAGKTYFLRRFIANIPTDVEVDIFDYHGDIDANVRGTESVLFSERTKYGYNPLRINLDSHYGGVRRAVQDVIAAIAQTSQKLGVKQEHALRTLLTDTYRARGIEPDDPASWDKEVGNRRILSELRENNDQAELQKYYPTLRDVLDLARRRMLALRTTIDDTSDGSKTFDAFEEFRKSVVSLGKLRRLIERNERLDINTTSSEQAIEKADALKVVCKAHFADFLDRFQDAPELDDLVMQSNKDVLFGVATRIESMIDIGLFEPNPPPFGRARIRRYVLRPLAQSTDELVMFVRLRLQAIIREMMQAGPCDGRLKRVIVLDESKPFNDDTPDNPLNVIATQMRKFGLGLTMAAQSPNHFSDDFIKNAGSMMLFNVATADWDDAARRLKIDRRALRHLSPREIGAVKLVNSTGASGFRGVFLYNPITKAPLP